MNQRFIGVVYHHNKASWELRQTPLIRLALLSICLIECEFYQLFAKKSALKALFFREVRSRVLIKFVFFYQYFRQKTGLLNSLVISC